VAVPTASARDETAPESPFVEVVEGARKSGEDTWHAEMNVPRVSLGVARFMKIRGPSRLSMQEAENDGSRMQAATAAGGVAACRQTQIDMKKEKLTRGGVIVVD